MVCKPTSCVKRRRSGFTLVELMFAMSIGLVVLATAMVLWGFASRTCAGLMSYVDLSAQSKNASDSMSQVIRNAKSVQSCSANQLVLLDPDGQRVTLAYNSDARTLAMTKGANIQTLLTECTNFQFSVYQRTPVSNSFALSTNAWATNTAKVVQMQWSCLRKLTGDKDNVESQVSSKVVIRNQ